jgi:hypothetical protein
MCAVPADVRVVLSPLGPHLLQLKKKALQTDSNQWLTKLGILVNNGGQKTTDGFRTSVFITNNKHANPCPIQDYQEDHNHFAFKQFNQKKEDNSSQDQARTSPSDQVRHPLR